MPTLGPSAISGACAGLVSSIITCPLDVVKTKLQAQAARPRNTQGAPAASSPPQSSSSQAKGKTIQPPRGAIAPSSSSLVGANGTQVALENAKRLGASAAVQDEGERVYKGLIGTLRTIYRDDGIRGFYRGLGPTIFGYLPTWAIYFTVYDGCKEFLASRGGMRDRGEDDFLNHIVSAMTAGGASTVCTSPLWVVKTRFMVSVCAGRRARIEHGVCSVNPLTRLLLAPPPQLQSAKPRDPSHPPPYRHTLDAFVRIMRDEGPRGFYRGLLPSLMGVSHVAVQFPLYENFKGWARASSLADEGGDLPPRIILLCSSTAKMIASVLTYPHEVVRTRLQMQPQARKAAQAKAEAGGAHANGNGNGQRLAAAASGADGSGGTGRRELSTLARTQAATTPARTRHPHDVPTRSFSAAPPSQPQHQQHQKYTSVIRTVRTILAEEGLRGFYNGMGVNLIRTVPSSALTILTYEVMMQNLLQAQHQQQSEREEGQGGETQEGR